jgi:hypothetical protein
MLFVMHGLEMNLMSANLMNGMAAWIWIDLDGRGPSWQLAVPVERDDWAEIDEDDDETCRWQALFPYGGTHVCEVDELIGCPERPLDVPKTAPSEEEFAAAKELERFHFGDDDEDE